MHSGRTTDKSINEMETRNEIPSHLTTSYEVHASI